MKHLISLFLCLVLVCTLLCGCSNSTPGTSETSNNLSGEVSQQSKYEEGSYVLLVYMCGSSLETQNGSATKNLEQMLSVDISQDVKVVVQTGGAKTWRKFDIPADKSCRYEVVDGELVLVNQDNNVNMGLSSSLSDFIVWGIENYPAEKYSLILWNHGGGSLGGVCYDENHYNDTLSLKELDEAFSIANVQFEFVGFDACLMATYETAVIVKKYAKNMLASQEMEPSGGWDYSILVANLGKDDFYQKLLQGYATKYVNNNYFTLSHIDFSKFYYVEDAFTKLVEKLKLEQTPRNIIVTLRNTINFGMTSADYYDLFDLGGLCKNFSIETQIEKCITTVNGNLRNKASGISLYFPLNSYSNLTRYSSVSPLEQYISYLENFYLMRDSETISFLSYAENIDNNLGFRLTYDSLKNVQDVSYSLISFEQDGQRVFSLGQDSDVNVYSQLITVDFNGKWAFLDGNPLACEIVTETSENIIFFAPVTVDFQFAELIFTYDKVNKTTEIAGVIYEGEEGRIHELKEGQIIQVTRNEVTGDKLFQWNYEDEIVYNEDTQVDIDYLQDGLYQYTAFVTDVYGNRFTAGTAMVEMENGKATILYVSSDEVDQD